MFLLVLDKDSKKSAELVPNRLKFKQTLELAQLICSCGFSSVYKPIPQAKELKRWIKYYNIWTHSLFFELVDWCAMNINLKEKTLNDFYKIRGDMLLNGEKGVTKFVYPKTAIFRYVKEYAEFTEYESNVELPIDECIKCYKKYLSWKEEQFNGKRYKK